MNPNYQKMMKQVQKMQADMAKMQEELANEVVEASAGGKEQRDDSSQENDWNQKQDQGPKREAACRWLGH